MPSSEPADYGDEPPPRSSFDYIEAEEPQYRAYSSGSGSSAGRLFGIARGLLQIHVDIAKREAAADQARLVRGVVFLTLALFLLLLVLLVGQALGAWLLHAAGLSWTWALAGVAGGDLILSLLLFALGRRALRAPVLPETRALLRRTAAALLDP